MAGNPASEVTEIAGKTFMNIYNGVPRDLLGGDS